MPTYHRFEEVPVWQESIRLAEGVYKLTQQIGKRLSYSAKDQIERAALSVSNNIAEGYERGTTNELLAFLYIARGSAGEVRSMLCFFERHKVLCEFKPQISNLKSVAESCSRQLRAWADALQNSEIKGQRHLNKQSRAEFDHNKRIEQGEKKFRKMLLDSLPPGHPARPEE